MLATRLWQNTAKVHFDATQREDGRRLIYGGHVISLARALSFNGLANAQLVAAINAGAHVNPCFAGDTVGAWSEVLDKAETAAPGVGALRLRTVAAKAGAGLRAPRRGGEVPAGGAARPRLLGAGAALIVQRRLAMRRPSGVINLRPTLFGRARAILCRGDAEVDMADVNRGNRPLSPFMIGPIYRPQINSIMSICHRLTGLGLALTRDAGGLVVPGRGDRPRLFRLRRRAAHLVDRHARHVRVAGGALVPLLHRPPAPGLGRRRRARQVADPRRAASRCWWRRG